MELELKFTEVTGCEPVGDLVTTQEESMETAIPEYCPDTARIVDTVGQLRLAGKAPDRSAAHRKRQRGADGAVHLGGEHGPAEPVHGGAVFLPGGG